MRVGESLPWLKFSPSEYSAYVQQGVLSLEAEGLFMRMITQSWALAEPGVFSVGIRPMTIADICRAARCQARKGKRLIRELFEFGFVGVERSENIDRVSGQSANSFDETGDSLAAIGHPHALTIPWVVERADEARQKAASRSKAGTKGANARWGEQSSQLTSSGQSTPDPTKQSEWQRHDDPVDVDVHLSVHREEIDEKGASLTSNEYRDWWNQHFPQLGRDSVSVVTDEQAQRFSEVRSLLLRNGGVDVVKQLPRCVAESDFLSNRANGHLVSITAFGDIEKVTKILQGTYTSKREAFSNEPAELGFWDKKGGRDDS